MHSIQTKTTLLNVIGIAVAVTAATVISAFTIANLGHESSEKLLKLSCETGKEHLDTYFLSVKKSVSKVQEYIQNDLFTVADDADAFINHVQEVREYFSEAAIYTQGVLTYYYRINPDVSDAYGATEDYHKEALGFYYTKPDNQDAYEEHKVTDLHLQSDGTPRSGTEWYFEYVPEANPNRDSKWLAPYTTHGFGAYVVSYNAPVYKGNDFYGVVGIEIGYHTLGDQISGIKVHDSGFAYLVDAESAKLIYHPDVELINTLPEERPAIPENLKIALKNGNHHFEYRYEGDNKGIKHAYWENLENGMCIVVAVPLSEVNNTWQMLVLQIVIIALLIMALFAVISIIFSHHFTKPLRELAEVAEEINEGHYDAKLEYHGDDEIGLLTNTVNKLVDHLGGYISDLNSLAYADALTSVRNKSAFDLHISQMQQSLDNHEELRFAIAIFDCDDLKDINDNYGHDKGDVYLKNSCHLICRVFNKSPVFRIGGDEFAVILQGEDYNNKDKLRKYFIEKSSEISAFAKEPWEQIRVAVGIAEYNPVLDTDIEEIIKRADHLMYENKRLRKEKK